MREKDLILETISMPDVLRDFAGVEGKYRRLNECPINGCAAHDGFAYTDRVFHCFVCGAKGDVIGFVMAYLDCDFKTALIEINRRYRLRDDGGVKGMDADLQKKAQIRAERRRQARRVQEYQQRQENALNDELERLTANKVKFVPRNIGDELDPRYIEALQRLPTQEYIVESDTVGHHGSS